MTGHSTAHYWFAPDGDDEPTMWRMTRGEAFSRQDPHAVLRRCENPEVFDLLAELMSSDGQDVS